MKNLSKFEMNAVKGGAGKKTATSVGIRTVGVKKSKILDDYDTPL